MFSVTVILRYMYVANWVLVLVKVIQRYVADWSIFPSGGYTKVDCRLIICLVVDNTKEEQVE